MRAGSSASPFLGWDSAEAWTMLAFAGINVRLMRPFQGSSLFE